ncbi:metallophosphoesterase [soil metagenome]
MNAQPYDLIGDIHGQHGKLIALLNRLNYHEVGSTWKHPEGRKVIFLGDYIDRGPMIREVLHTVREMVDAGDALAIMGNHEFNAISYATADGKGGYLRERIEKNVKQHARTLMAFKEREDEWSAWIQWMKRLPMFLDLGGLRAVHAAWDARHLEILNGTPLLDDHFLLASAAKGTPEYDAVEVLLKGPEMTLPDGLYFEDKEHIKRKNIRVRWWGLEEGIPIGDLVMPEPMPELHESVTAEMLLDLPNYGANEPPVFFGHYWLPPHREKAPLARNLASLDYSAAFGENPLTAYRWDGEQVLSAEKFITNT